MIFDRKLLLKLDIMLDEAIAGTFQAQSYDESQLSKIESKMARFLEQSRLKREQIESEREHVRSLISDISHQTKTPLSNVALYSQLLAEQDLTDEQAKFAKQISVSADKLTFLIQALVNWYISTIQQSNLRQWVSCDIRAIFICREIGR